MDQALRAIDQWRSRGRLVDVDGRAIFTVDEGEGPICFVLMHGFPSSSFDWRLVIDLLTLHSRVVAFDFLGYGLSDKPPDGAYSVRDQADVAHSLLQAVGVESCVLVGHDMGDTVAAELLRRAQEDRGEMEVHGVALTNGSIFADQAELPAAQRLLLGMPDEPLPMPLPLEALVPGLAAAFSAEHPAARRDLEAMLWLIGHREGDRLLPRLVRHVEERRREEERWLAGLVGYPGPLALLWGAQDPVSPPDTPERLAALRPGTQFESWPDAGHWPALEVPERLVGAILERLELP